jgi:hypothetical protein
MIDRAVNPEVRCNIKRKKRVIGQRRISFPGLSASSLLSPGHRVPETLPR